MKYENRVIGMNYGYKTNKKIVSSTTQQKAINTPRLFGSPKTLAEKKGKNSSQINTITPENGAASETFNPIEQEIYRKMIEQHYNISIPSDTVNTKTLNSELKETLPTNWDTVKPGLSNNPIPNETQHALNIALDTAILKKLPLAARTYTELGADLLKKDGTPFNKNDYEHMYKTIKAAENKSAPDTKVSLYSPYGFNPNPDVPIKQYVIKSLIQTATMLLIGAAAGFMKHAFQELNQYFSLRWFGQKMTQTNFSNYNLSGGQFVNTNLRDSDFSGANLTSFKFINCNLKNTNFQNANLDRAIFKDCNINGIQLDGAKLTRTMFTQMQHMGGSYPNWGNDPWNQQNPWNNSDPWNQQNPWNSNTNHPAPWNSNTNQSPWNAPGQTTDPWSNNSTPNPWNTTPDAISYDPSADQQSVNDQPIVTQDSNSRYDLRPSMTWNGAPQEDVFYDTQEGGQSPIQ